MQHRHNKSQSRILRNDIHVPRLCTKPYGWYILHVKYTHETYRTRPRCHMDKKTYSEYISRKENTKATSYILQDEENSFNWDHIKMDPVNTESMTENLKVKTNRDSRKE